MSRYEMKGKWASKINQVCWEKWTQSVTNSMIHKKTAIINRNSSLNVKDRQSGYAPEWNEAFWYGYALV